MEVAGAGADRGIEPRHRLEIVVEDVGPGFDDGLDRARLAHEVGGQDLDGGRRGGVADRPDDGREMAGAAIVEVVAVDRGDHDMVQAELAHRLGDMRRLVRIDQVRPSGRDVAEGAGTGAHAAQDHHRGVLLLPALADVGAGRLLADGVELEAAHQRAGLVIFRRDRRLDPDPVRLAQGRAVRARRLLGVAQPGRVVGGRSAKGHRSPWWRGCAPA